jgi:hypothetical protein
MTVICQPGISPGIVAAFAGAAAIAEAGGAAVGVPADVINMADRRTTKPTTTSLLIAEPDEVSQPALETALMLIRSYDRTRRSART